jgi:hypothetical protein
METARKSPLFYMLWDVGHFGPHRFMRLRGIRNWQAARESVERILRWDFDRRVNLIFLRCAASAPSRGCPRRCFFSAGGSTRSPDKTINGPASSFVTTTSSLRPKAPALFADLTVRPI